MRGPRPQRGSPPARCSTSTGRGTSNATSSCARRAPVRLVLRAGEPRPRHPSPLLQFDRDVPGSVRTERIATDPPRDDQQQPIRQMRQRHLAASGRPRARVRQLAPKPGRHGRRSRALHPCRRGREPPRGARQSVPGQSRHSCVALQDIRVYGNTIINLRRTPGSIGFGLRCGLSAGAGGSGVFVNNVVEGELDSAVAAAAASRSCRGRGGRPRTTRTACWPIRNWSTSRRATCTSRAGVRFAIAATSTTRRPGTSTASGGFSTARSTSALRPIASFLLRHPTSGSRRSSSRMSARTSWASATGNEVIVPS